MHATMHFIYKMRNVIIFQCICMSLQVDGRELICLPQAFELFLKHLVGGLHTVYTKLKRLDITPVVCNVEQVRILRGLGAIQPGVNRCKLILPREFDILYEDCTNSRCVCVFVCVSWMHEHFAMLNFTDFNIIFAHFDYEPIDHTLIVNCSAMH